MNHHQTGMLSKIMAVGFLGLLATMGMLLYTLQLAEQGDGLVAAKPTSISPLAFQSLLRQGEVIECTLEAGRVRGLRRGGGQERIQFQVDGEVSPRLMRELVRRRVPLHRIPERGAGRAETQPSRSGPAPTAAGP